MKTIFKKSLRFTTILTLCLVSVTLLVTNSCDKQETSPTTCYFENPLTDLLWLKEKIDEFNLSAQGGQKLSISIYQCIYDDGKIGFLEDHSNIMYFYNCEGETLCMMNEGAGKSCLELNIVSKKLIWKTLEINNFPIEILFTEYSLEGTLCQWKKLPEDYYSTIVIINSNEKLENFIECTSGNQYPKIDFSKYTLLLAYGMERYMFFPNNKSLQQISTYSYVMKVNLYPNIASVLTYWQVPIVVNKIADDSFIELIVTKNY